MNRKVLTLGLGAVLPLLLAGCAPQRPAYYGAPPPPGYRQGPPQGMYRQAQRAGYEEGMEAARRDLRRGLRPDADRHGRFRRPPVAPPVRNEYREAFQRGYQEVYRHARRGDDDRD